MKHIAYSAIGCAILAAVLGIPQSVGVVAGDVQRWGAWAVVLAPVTFLSVGVVGYGVGRLVCYGWGVRLVDR